MENKTKKLYIDILKQEVKPALGCTEPIALALAVAKACELIKQRPTRMIIEVSANILKNGMGVGIPGTGMVGLDIAVALSIICGKSEYGLEVLREVCENAVEFAKELITKKIVEIRLAETSEKLYIAATAISEQHTSKVIISSCHDNISYMELDGKCVTVDSSDCASSEPQPEIIDTREADMTIRKIYDFTTTVELEEVEFILQTKVLNMALSQEGLTKDYGLQVGKLLYSKMNTDLIGNSLISYSMALTAAASDARMAGCMLPAMSNSGSGNQGITVTMPVVATAERLKSTDEQLIRALVLSHLVAIHIKSHLGRLSALCGCVVASSGASCGITYLNGGEYKEIVASLKNMMGNITGMVCDGAKVGCAMKVATGVSCAVQSSMLATEGICISENDGIIDKDIEKTIANLGAVGSEGMKYADEIMLRIMINKCN